MNRLYNVWRYVNGHKTWTGIVQATNATLAATKASRLYRHLGQPVWCEEKNNGVNLSVGR